MRTPRQLCSGRAWQTATAPARAAWAQADLPCAICQQPINYALPHPHKMRLTVDHIIPLANGGPPLDPTNWQPAHLSCNGRRGKRPVRRTALTW